jgi:adenine-specific DNA-methyltransferase
MFSYTDKYQRNNFLIYFKYILPIEEEIQNFKVSNDNLLKSVTKIANVNFKPNIPIFEVEHFSKNDPRVELTNNLFAILNKFSIEKALVIFFCRDSEKYRFSLIESSLVWVNEVNVKRKFSHPKRLSFLLGHNTKVHTPYNQFKKNILDYNDLKKRFDKEVVTEEFFENYKRLYQDLLIKFEADNKFKNFLKNSDLKIEIFTRKLLGQIIFCYFLQKKGWLGAVKESKIEEGDLDFFRNKFNECIKNNKNFFNDYLEVLFYEGLNKDNKEQFCKNLECKVPFLNGGLFEEIPNYNWRIEKILIPNSIFSNKDKAGILDIFDLYNLTVDESTDFDVEIAIDPEMLGKVFESLIPENLKKKMGIFYTDRSVVTYMCRDALISYLFSSLSYKISKKDLAGLFFIASDTKFLTYENLPTKIRKYANLIDYKLRRIKICDPAVGSGAFPISMMHEVSQARHILQKKKKRITSLMQLKKNFIEKSLYAVDVDPGSIEIAKLRLWLAIIVDEKKYQSDLILPNLDFKIIEANSLQTYEIDIFNYNEYENVIKLKNEFYTERNPDLKYKIKNKINIFINKLKKLEKFDFRIIFFEVFNSQKISENGFDIVIGNPPYIGEKECSEEIRKLKNSQLFRFFARRVDYFYFFFHLANEIMNNNGVCSYITTNYYITATQGKNLRSDLKERSQILSLINFNELKIFKSAKGQHNIITTFTRDKKYKQDCKTIFSTRQGDTTKEDLDEILYGESSFEIKKIIPSENVFEGPENYIRLDGKIFNDGSLENLILQKISENSSNLISFYDVNAGLNTGVDKISNLHLNQFERENFQKGDGVFVVNENELERLKINKKENDICKPFFKNSDIQKYKIDRKNFKFLFYLTRDLELKNYPNIERHILKYEKVIKARATDRGEIQAALAQGKWWVVFAARKKKIFESDKIVCPQRSKLNKFAFHRGKFYASGDVYYITNKNLSNYSLFFLTAILNSKLFYFWLKKKGKVKGDNLELYHKPLTEIPIKFFEEKITLDLENYIDQILNNKKSIDEIKKIDKKINSIVYQAYKLTSEEINYIENFYPKENEQ